MWNMATARAQRAFLSGALGALLLTGAVNVAATEEPAFEMLARIGEVEIRRYAPYVVAEVDVEESFEDASSRAFGTLADYIFGNNNTGTKLAMTAPVAQFPADAAKASAGDPSMMTATAPSDAGVYTVRFILPATTTLSTAPTPLQPEVRLSEVQPRTMAVVRYTGTWSKENYDAHESRLLAALSTSEIEPVGQPEWARYNQPLTPWFMRRNEVMIEVHLPHGTL